MAKTTKKLPNDTIILFGKQHKLKPYMGKRARLLAPKVIKLVSGLLDMSVRAGVNLTALFDPNTNAEDWLKENGPNITRLIVFITTYWEEKATEIEDMLPFLLQVEPEELEDQGEPSEVYWAMFRALRYFYTENLSEDVKAALARLGAANPTPVMEEEPPESDPQESEA